MRMTAISHSGATMQYVKDNETFLTLVGEFGPGLLTVELEGILSRPVLPVVDRKLGEALCVVDKT
jgi:hypothetical protein